MEMKRSVFVASLVLITTTGAVARLRADEARTMVMNEIAWIDAIDAGHGD